MQDTSDISRAQYDYVFVGSGFTALSVASALIHKDPSLRLCFISKEVAVGGVWNNASNGVRLHQRTHAYALPTVRYDDPSCHTDGLHTASCEQVRGYARKVFEHVSGVHIVGQVRDVEAIESGSLKLVKFVPPGASKVESVTSRYVVQATGFDFYSGEPRIMGVPHEVHSSRIAGEAPNLSGKTCLVVGSGKSALDAVRLLVSSGSKVKCVYRTPTAFISLRFTAWYAHLLQMINPAYYIIYFLNRQLCAASNGTLDDRWEYDWSSEDAAKTLKYFVVGDGVLNDSLMLATRGGICRRTEYLLMSLMLHAHGMQGDVNKMRFCEEVSGGEAKVICEAFPNERFDYVVTCTGYRGTTRQLPNCINALTPILDLHLISGWLMGNVIHSIKDDLALVSSWNALASYQAPHPWVGHYHHTRLWCQKHCPETMEAAWNEMQDGLAEACNFTPAHPLLHPVTTRVDKMLAVVMDTVFETIVWFMWKFAPKSASRAALTSFGKQLAAQ